MNANRFDENDECLKNAWQDFNHFKEKMLEMNPSQDMNFDEIVDLYISHGGVNSCGTSSSTMDKFTTTVQDFNGFESTVRPLTHAATNAQAIRGLDINREIQESEMMINEAAEREGDSRNFKASTHQGNINCEAELGCSSKTVTYITHGDMNCYGLIGGEIGNLLGGCSNVMRNSTSPEGRTERDFSVNGKANTRTAWNTRKRKYKGVIETEEETAARLERIKMNNRISAAKAQADRQAREVYLQTKVAKLKKKYEGLQKKMEVIQKKNEALEKLTECGEGLQEKINLPPKALRRTMSEPFKISALDIWKCNMKPETASDFFLPQTNGDLTLLGEVYINLAEL